MSQTKSSDVEGEIVLADIVAALYRRRWMILSGALLGLVAALLAGLLETPKYDYRARMEIGRLYSTPPDAETELGRALALLDQRQALSSEKYGFRYIEWPESVVDHLRAVAFAVYDRMFVNEGQQPGFSVERDFKSSFEHINRQLEDTTIVEGTLRASKNAPAVEFLNATMQVLIDEHEQIMSAHLDRLERDVKRLMTRLEVLAENKDGLQHRLTGLDQEKELIEKRIEKTTERLTRLQDTAAKDLKNPMYLVLINGEIGQTRNSIDELRGRLLSDIPEMRHMLQLESGHVRDEIMRLENQVESIRAASKSTMKSRLVSSATRGEDRVAPNYSLYGVLGLLAGLFLAVFVAFMLEFWRHNKTRITENTSQ